MYALLGFILNAMHVQPVQHVKKGLARRTGVTTITRARAHARLRNLYELNILAALAGIMRAFCAAPLPFYTHHHVPPSADNQQHHRPAVKRVVRPVMMTAPARINAYK